MSYLCFGTFFTLLCGNKKDWDKLRKPEVSNRVLYAALLDIVDKKTKSTYHVEAAQLSDKDYIASEAKLCKRDDHPIQRTGAVLNYVCRFKNNHNEVLLDFVNFINKYLDKSQLNRLALSILELIIRSDISDSDLFCIESSLLDEISKKEIRDTKRDFNLPALLAGVLYYILESNVPNGSENAQATIEEWNGLYKKAPKCPVGASLGADYKITLTCEVPDCLITVNGDVYTTTQINENKAEDSQFLTYEYLRLYFTALENEIADAKLYFADNNYPSKLQDVYVSLPINLRVDLEVKDKSIVGIRLLQIDDNGQGDEIEAFEPVGNTKLHSFLSCLSGYVSENKEYKFQDKQKRPKILAPTFSDGEKIAFWEINGIDAAAIFDQFVILGDPGKGKSTLFRFFTLKLIEQYYSEENVFVNCTISDEFYLSKYVPVFIEMKDIASWYKDEELNLVDSKVMLKYLSKRYVHNWKKQFINDNIFTHNCIYILDGLDEVEFNLENRNFVISLIKFVQQILKNQCKLLISCRKRDFSNWDLSAINIYHLRSMNDYVASQLIQQVFRTKLKAIPSTRLLDELHRIGMDVDLVGNPLFLSLIAQLYIENQKDFPSTKSRILRESILLLLKRKPTEILEKFSLRDGVEELFPALENIAFEMQQSADKPSFRISSKDLTGIVCNTIGYCTRDELYDFLASTTGLISNVGDNFYEFSHRRFQEYLCASYLFNQKSAIEAASIIKNGLLYKKRIWSEVAIWYLEMMCDYESTERIVITLKQLTVDNKDGWVSWYIGMIIESMNYQLIDKNSLLTNNDIEQLRELFLSTFLDIDSLPMCERAFCGKILGYLGDPRHGVSLNAEGMPDIAWCHMNAGIYKIGVSDEIQKTVKGQVYGNNKWGTKIVFSREIPQREIQLNEFYISKYPVTVAQFHAFIDNDDGYFCYDNWRWSNASSEWYRLNVVDKTVDQIKQQKGKSNAPNFPVTNVSWIEAVAFCKWLSKRTDETYRLPTEGEWEAAARSSYTVFTWGDEFESQKCNSSFSGIGDIVPVGMFSAFVEDDIPSEMNGNVWDWCYSVYPAWDSKVENLSVYSENKNIVGSCNYNRLTLNTMCSVRGGSYINTPMFLMSSFRGRDKIGLSFYRQGFRIVKEVVPHPLENSMVLLNENGEIPSQLEYFKEGAGVLVSPGDRVRLSYSVMKDGEIIEDMTKPIDNIEVILGKGQLQQEIDDYILAHNPRISTSFDTYFSVFTNGSNDDAETYRFYIQIMDRE